MNLYFAFNLGAGDCQEVVGEVAPGARRAHRALVTRLAFGRETINAMRSDAELREALTNGVRLERVLFGAYAVSGGACLGNVIRWDRPPPAEGEEDPPNAMNLMAQRLDRSDVATITVTNTSAARLTFALVLVCASGEEGMRHE